MKMNYDSAEASPLHIAMKKKSPKLRISASYDEYGDMGMDKDYRKREMKRLKDKKKGLAKAMKDLTPEYAHSMAKKSLEQAMKKADFRMLEYEDDDYDM